MKFRPILLSLVIPGLAGLPGCGKEHAVPSSGGPVMTHIAMQVDSAFIEAPNVVTPDFNGINDLFNVIAVNVTSLEVTVTRPDGDTAFHSNLLTPIWTNLDSTDLGHYALSISAVSGSGALLSGQSSLDLLSYGGGPCLPYAGTPVTGDQFDPRIFGVVYPTSDIFCE